MSIGDVMTVYGDWGDGGWMEPGWGYNEVMTVIGCLHSKRRERRAKSKLDEN